MHIQKLFPTPTNACGLEKPGFSSWQNKGYSISSSPGRLLSPPSLLLHCAFFPRRYSCRSVNLAKHLHLVLSLRMT